MRDWAPSPSVDADVWAPVHVALVGLAAAERSKSKSSEGGIQCRASALRFHGLHAPYVTGPASRPSSRSRSSEACGRVGAARGRFGGRARQKSRSHRSWRLIWRGKPTALHAPTLNRHCEWAATRPALCLCLLLGSGRHTALTNELRRDGDPWGDPALRGFGLVRFNIVSRGVVNKRRKAATSAARHECSSAVPYPYYSPKLGKGVADDGAW
ncbi:hypothetical protein B0T14DRAFT_221635 [Immersiella caudata]|uniref:Uncharacterized protein n=1 Tax=Immersiella caudata TaxID=314043 RepID=A0AA39WR36_9PEZI|nr:hypothetical protein B0T14DRAFT_221635 [Immersiella caudata]